MRGSQTLPKSKQLLFVVEGKCSESELIHSAMKSIGVNTERYAVAAFHTNVHALIETIVVESDWRPDDFAAVEIREVLAEILENGGGSLQVMWGHDEEVKHLGPDWLRNTHFTDTFLMFDFDPHDDRYNASKLTAFQQAFCDSAGDVGKLLLSYPMFESYREACALEISDYLHTEASEPFSAYKHMVHRRLHDRGLGKLCDLAAFNRTTFAKGIAQTVVKAYYLLAGCDASVGQDVVSGIDLASRCDAVDLVGLLSLQQDAYEQSDCIPSISTVLFFLTLWSKKLNQAWALCKSEWIV